MNAINQTPPNATPPANNQGQAAPKAAGPGPVMKPARKARSRDADVPAVKSVPATKAAAHLDPAAIANPFKFWDDFFAKTKFKTPDEAETFLFFTLGEMQKSNHFDQAEAALKSFMRAGNHQKDSQPWMYVWLAECVKARKGSESEMKEALSFAAYLAKKTKNPNDLIRVADMLVINKFYGPVGAKGFETNIGELVDLAAEKVPANFVPPMMSINLAAHDKDPKRMGDSAEKLLALGWPDIDEKIRRDTKEQVTLLAEALRNGGKPEESEALLARLASSEVRDVYARLTWKGEADVDLRVAEPLGAIAKVENRRTVFGGALIKNGYGSHPEEVYVCPRAMDVDGDYTFTVEKIVDWEESKPVTSATLEIILHEGGANEQRQVHQVDLAKPSPIVVHLPKGAGRRKEVLPMLIPVERVVTVERPRAPVGKPKAKAANPPAPAGAPIR